jgi:hypothetical protein
MHSEPPAVGASRVTHCLSEFALFFAPCFALRPMAKDLFGAQVGRAALKHFDLLQNEIIITIITFDIGAGRR